MALTVVPVLAYFLVDRVRIEVDETGEPKRSIWVRLYTPTIKLVLSRRATKLGVIALATILFFVTTALVPLLSTAFISTGSEKKLQVIVVPPPGASSEAVLARSIETEDILRADEDVELIATGVPAEGETGFATISSAFAGIRSDCADASRRRFGGFERGRAPSKNPAGVRTPPSDWPRLAR